MTCHGAVGGWVPAVVAAEAMYEEPPKLTASPGL
jgi:hypothetical protein